MKTPSTHSLKILKSIAKQYLTILASCIAVIFFTTPSSGQYNVVDWASYFIDSSTTFNYADDELIDDIKIDNQNPENIYVVGRTRSAVGSSVPCTGNTLTYGNGDILLAKYDRCGRLQWSRYLGNKKKTDYGYTLALDYDTAGNTTVYIAGEMKTNGKAPTTIVCDGGNAPFRIKPAGTWDAFIAKYDQNGNLQRWTYFGGNDSALEKVDQILGVAVNNHNVFVVGYTESPDLYKGALHADDTTFEGSGDGFLAEFSPDLHNLNYFSYIGGPGRDRCHGIEIYQSGIDTVDIFVDGTTPSSTGIFAGNGFDNSLAGDLDGFVGKWEDDDGDGKFTKTWCTYIGGNSTERARDMDVDNHGNIMLVGQTNSATLPFAKGYDSTYNGGTDAFIIKIPNAGGIPIWGTYFGGYADEEAVGFIWKKGDDVNHVLIGGITYSSQKTTCLPVPNPNNFPVFQLQNPLISLINGKKGASYCPGTVGDAFIAEITDTSAGQSLVFSSYLGGSGNEVNGENQLSYNPSFAITSAGELYIAFNVKSTDIQKVFGSKLQTLYGTYHGGIDAFVARLIDTTSTEYNCTDARYGEIPASATEDGSVSVYPNPSSKLFNIEIWSDVESMVSCKVFDNLGRVVFAQSLLLSAGTNISSVDLSYYPNGLYILQIYSPDKTYQVKLIKQ